MARTKSSNRWLQEHFDDIYVKKAQQDGYRSRAAYKLIEIQEKDHIIRPGMTILDLGAAPGGWSQVAAHYAGDRGTLIASDILPMDPVPGVTFIEGDFREDAIFTQLLEIIGDNGVDLVISDMAPNMSGTRAVDQPRAMFLVELALDMATRVLRPGGDFVVKVFQGEGFDALRKNTQHHFHKLQTRKPDASRARSHETYWLARDFKG